MAMVVDLDVVLAIRKMKLTELAKRVDITVPNLSILKSGRARAIRMSTLEAICKALQCQPGDLLRYAPDRGPPPRPLRHAENWAPQSMT